MKILQLSAVFILPEIGFCFFFQKILITFGTILTEFPGRTSGKTKILKKKLKISDRNQIINGFLFSVSNRNGLLEIFSEFVRKSRDAELYILLKNTLLK